MKCESWIQDDYGDDDDDYHSEQLKSAWLSNSLMGLKEKLSLGRSFPFSEDKLFVLTLSAGVEGYHVNVDGRHVTSFPYHTVRYI